MMAVPAINDASLLRGPAEGDPSLTMRIIQSLAKQDVVSFHKTLLNMM
jgi:hypothetical protein